jgi:multiple sugar transport system permease protein
MASAAAPFEGFASRPSRRARTREERVLRALLYLVVAAGAVAFALPFYWMVRSAVMPPWQVWLYPPEWIPAGLHFENFLTPFAVFPFARWFANTAVVALATAVLTVATGAMVGFSFARLRFPLRDVLFVVLLSTMMLPDQVRLVPTYLLFVKLEWVNTFLPLVVPNGLGPAFYVFLMRQFFMTIPAELDDAAYIDGCSPFGVFWRIALPLSLPAAGVAAIYSVTYSWNDFLHPLLYLQKLELYTLALGLRLFQGQLATQIEAMMAAALMSALPTVIIFFLAQRYFVQGIVITGLKG